jgi:peptide/nickel transport system substrate-binding protein/oligopeptide transport system substrate-binding protein
MDPALVQDYYSYFPVELVFPGLLTLNANGTPIPWAAASAPVYDAAAKTYTIKVKPGLRWTDNTPINAQTYEYSINRALSPCTASPVTYYMFAIKDAPAFSTEKCGSDGVTVNGPIKSLIGDSLNAPDTQTLVITLSANAPYFLQALCYPTAFAQPQQLIQQYGVKEWTSHLTGFGGNLYKLQTWDHKGNVILVRNDSFWGAKPKLREIDFKVYQTVAAQYADYLDGRLDQGSAPPDQYVQSKKRSDFHELGALWINYYQPVWNKAPFDDVRVRQAFDLALNKDVLANQVNHGSVIPSNHIVPEGMYGYNPNLTGPDGTQNLTGNPARATQLMQSYANDKCGGKISSCTPVTLVDVNEPAVQTADQAAVAMWQAAFPGMTIKTQFIDFNSLITLIYSPNIPQIYGIAWIADYPDPQDWLSLQFAPGAINNTGNVVVPQANQLMAQADQDLNAVTRAQAYNQAEQLLVTNVAWITQNQQKLFYNLPTYVHNYQITSLGVIPLSNWQQIYLSAH